jgi:hypothetical protein
MFVGVRRCRASRSRIIFRGSAPAFGLPAGYLPPAQVLLLLQSNKTKALRPTAVVAGTGATEDAFSGILRAHRRPPEPDRRYISGGGVVCGP